MSRFTILVSGTESTPVSRGNLGPRGAGLKMSWLHPGGCADASFRIYAPSRFLPNFLGAFYDVKILDGGRHLWAGRMEDFTDHRGSDGTYWDVVCKGYGVNLDDQQDGSQNVQNVQTSVIISDAITRLTQQIDATSITATGFTISNSASVLLKLKATGLIKWAMSFGDSSDNPQTWYVEPDETDGTIRFTFKPRPTTADFEGYRSDFITCNFGHVGRQLYNRVSIVGSLDTVLYTANDTTLQGAGPAGWGFIRQKTVVLPEISDVADATQAGDFILGQVKTARMAAKGAMVLKRQSTLRDANGQRVDPWYLRASRLFKFRDVDPAEGALGNLAYNNTCLLAGVEWDEDLQTATLTPESHERSLDSVVAQTRSLLGGRHTV